MDIGKYDQSPLLVRKSGYPGRRMGFSVQVTHAHKDGSPVLKEGSSWRTVNGLVLRNVFGHRVFVMFRRWRVRS